MFQSYDVEKEKNVTFHILSIVGLNIMCVERSLKYCQTSQSIST